MTYKSEEERLAAKKESRRRYYFRKKEERNKNGWLDKRTLRKRTTYSKEYRLLAAAKNRAKAKGLAFDLREEDIIIPEICPVLGIPISLANSQTCGDSPSVDRIDSEKGYTKDNVRVISWRANKVKADATLKEIFLIYQYMLSENENKA